MNMIQIHQDRAMLDDKIRDWRNASIGSAVGALVSACLLNTNTPLPWGLLPLIILALVTVVCLCKHASLRIQRIKL